MIFGKHKEMMRELETEVSKLKYDLKQSRIESEKNRQKANDYDLLNGKFLTLNKQLREQNEADLLLSSMRIIEEIKSGKKKEDITDLIIKQQQELDRQAMLNQMATNQGIAYGLANIGAIHTSRLFWK